MAVLVIEQMVLTRGADDQAFIVSLPSLNLAAGEVLAITGPSGCGKSTLIEAFGLILRPQSLRQYHLLGQDVTDLVRGLHATDDRRLAHLRSQYFGFVPQSGGILPYLTVEQNVLLQARIQGCKPDPAWLSDVTARLGLQDFQGRYPRDLSMGQRQRVSFLRAIAHRPAILLADEPTAALDPYHAAQLFELMLEIVSDAGVAAVVVTHEWDLIESLALQRLQAQAVNESQMEFVRQ